MDAVGNLTWYINVGGWWGYAPGRPSATSPGGFNAAIQNDKLALTDRMTGTVREVNATDSAIRSVYNRTGGWALGIFGDADDFGLPMHLAAAGGEGEASSPTVGEDSELLVKQMRGEYRVKHPGLQPLHGEARVLLMQLGRVRFVHVRREANTHADGLANLAMDTAAKRGGQTLN